MCLIRFNLNELILYIFNKFYNIFYSVYKNIGNFLSLSHSIQIVLLGSFKFKVSNYLRRNSTK